MSADIVEYKPKSFPNGDDYVRIWTTPGWFLWMLGFRGNQYAFRGNGTVWRHYPDGTSAGSAWEATICRLVAAEETSPK